jgi:hypothetical protein
MSPAIPWILVILAAITAILYGLANDQMVNELKDTGETKYADPRAIIVKRGWLGRVYFDSDYYQMHRERFPASRLRIRARALGIITAAFVVAFSFAFHQAKAADRLKEIQDAQTSQDSGR